MANPKVFFDVRIGTQNVGRMIFELYADVTPKTAENFRCLCTGEKGKARKSGKPLHFKNTIFHRIIKGFMAQGGDFERADGTGGESIYGDRFNDENFIRKHIGPGMLSMANAGKHTNGSQFFITFKSTPHLNGKHVVFGKLVGGMEVLNMLENTPCNRGDRPVNEVCIYNTGEVGKEAEQKAREDKEAAAKQSSAGTTNDEELDIDGLSDDDDDDEEEENAEADPAEAAKSMNPREKKLFELRLKLNQARKANKREAKEEHKRLNTKQNSHAGKHREYKNKKEEWEKQIQEQGVDSSEYFLFESAESVAHKDKVKGKKGKAAFGWDVFNQDAYYKAYKNRLKEQRKNSDTEFRDMNSLDFQKHEPEDADVNRMVSELNQTAERRKKFSRRRAHNEGEDIDYINKRNAVFNKKIKRAFDKYTAEIKSNLERGTAL